MLVSYSPLARQLAHKNESDGHCGSVVLFLRVTHVSEVASVGLCNSWTPSC